MNYSTIMIVRGCAQEAAVKEEPARLARGLSVCGDVVDLSSGAFW